MIITACAYLPEWLRRQCIRASLLPGGVGVDPRTDSWPIAGNTAIMVVEFRDLAIDQILDSWFASFDSDPPRFAGARDWMMSPRRTLREMQAERFTLVKLPDLIVPTLARTWETGDGVLGTPIDWQHGAAPADHYLRHQNPDEFRDHPSFFQTLEYRLNVVAPPMVIDRSQEAQHHAALLHTRA